MPIFWRYIIKNYLRIFLLTIFVFLSVLVLMRMQEIARFATLGTSPSTVIQFILLQFPIILPLAIPIAALIASVATVGRLSQSYELTSMRAQGLRIKDILFPIKITALFLTLFNFVIASELTPTTRLTSKNLIYQATAYNPLLLLRMNKVSQLDNAYADLNMIKSGQSAKDLVFAFTSGHSDRINLILADQIEVKEGGLLVGNQVSFLSNIKTKNDNSFDHLVLENYEQIENSSLGIATLLHQSDIKRLSVQKLRIKPLLIKTIFEKSKKQFAQSILEISRRTYLALITYSFAMLGAVFSIQIGREQRKKGLLQVILYASLGLASYLAAKSMYKYLILGVLCYILPHIIILSLSKWKRIRLERGIE